MFQQAAVTVLVNNFVKEATPHLGEHGFSLLLDFTLADGRQGQALLDTGRSGDVLVKNLADLGQNLDRLLAVILSHGHHDHTGGLPKLLERLGRRVLVVAHPGIWGMRLYDQPALHAVGVPFPRAAAEALGAEFCLAADPVRLEPGLLTTGEIPRREPLEEPVGFHRAVDGVYQAEQVTDDLSLVLDLGEEEGLFLLTGCCHAGLVNTLAHAREITGRRKVKGVLGGLHLKGASPERLELTARTLAELDPQIVAPMHCSGQAEAAWLRERLGDRVVFPGVGDRLAIKG